MQNLFIINLTYTADLDTVLKNRPDHVVFLQRHYDAGNFLASGPKVPREGGIILAQADSKDKVIDIANQDPFITRSLATYEITEFVPNMTADNFLKD
tara:strand:- start:9534 stop:9824 length:291 start_codon:yes stop_codon:yes gene_type:complete